MTNLKKSLACRQTHDPHNGHGTLLMRTTKNRRQINHTTTEANVTEASMLSGAKNWLKLPQILVACQNSTELFAAH